VGPYLEERLRAALGKHPLVGDVRGVGLIAGVELVADRATRQLFAPTLRIGPRVAQRCMEG
jgi:adenosylmethionine-8-amino-7-oxononanoate aminotransferase